jgi:hypothetical protein
MARPGFYNDNEYRVYPFVYRDNLVTLPDATIVDSGFIMGLDCFFDDAAHTVWLAEAALADDTLTLVFRTNANNAPLEFVVPVDTPEWSTVFSESAVADHPCAEEPIWSGFIVVGRLAEILTLIETAPRTFAANEYQIEPARLQNLNKAYVRSLSVGNYSRLVVPDCVSEDELQTIRLADRSIVKNATCLKGPLLLKEGYNCRITQTDRDRTLSVTAARGAGAQEDAALCETGGEVPLFTGEQPPEGSKFLSGGPACNELIFTLNGVGGSNVNIVGGQNVIIGGPDESGPPNTIKIELNSNIQGGCNG